MITTREELIIALSEAAEIEHGLLVQYLFAAFSIERKDIPRFSPRQQILLAEWQFAIFEVARQEMDHLAMVCNLLVAIGSSPQFHRPNFPQSNTSYFPLGKNNNEYHRYPFDFQLEKFGDCSLYRFIISELPEGVNYPSPPSELCPGNAKFKELSPRTLNYNHVGQLYALIGQGFTDLSKKLGEEKLFIGNHEHQDGSVAIIKDVVSAREVIKRIVFEGEGAPNDNEQSHYEQFVKIRSELAEELRQSDKFEPARNLAHNPQTRHNDDARGDITLITHPITAKLAELFNKIYITMLWIHQQYYSRVGETEQQIEALKRISRGIMSTMLRPVAEILTEMPVDSYHKDLMAGPCFEIYQPIRLPLNVRARWTLLTEQIDLEISVCEELLDHRYSFPCLARLSGVHENLKYILLDFKSISQAI